MTVKGRAAELQDECGTGSAAVVRRPEHEGRTCRGPSQPRGHWPPSSSSAHAGEKRRRDDGLDGDRPDAAGVTRLMTSGPTCACAKESQIVASESLRAQSRRVS